MVQSGGSCRWIISNTVSSHVPCNSTLSCHLRLRACHTESTALASSGHPSVSALSGCVFYCAWRTLFSPAWRDGNRIDIDRAGHGLVWKRLSFPRCVLQHLVNIRLIGKAIADFPRVALVVGRYYSRPSVLFEVPLFQHSELTASPVQANLRLK